MGTSVNGQVTEDGADVTDSAAAEATPAAQTGADGASNSTEADAPNGSAAAPVTPERAAAADTPAAPVSTTPATADQEAEPVAVAKAGEVHQADTATAEPTSSQPAPSQPTPPQPVEPAPAATADPGASAPPPSAPTAAGEPGAAEPTTGDQPTQDRPTQDRPTQDRPAQESPADESAGQASHEPAEDEAAGPRLVTDPDLHAELTAAIFAPPRPIQPAPTPPPAAPGPPASAQGPTPAARQAADAPSAQPEPTTRPAATPATPAAPSPKQPAAERPARSGVAANLVENRPTAEQGESTGVLPAVRPLPSRAAERDAPVNLLDLESTPPRGWRRPRIGLLAPAGALLMVVCALVIQMLRPVPAPTITLAARQQVLVPGVAPALPWPTAGQAAVQAVGVGNLGDSGPARPQPIASVTKVMTAYVILRDHPLGVNDAGPVITVDAAEAARYQARLAGSQSLVKVAAGAAFTEREALEALLLPSADNIADVLARWDAGSIPAFAAKMNAAAGTLGMHDTTYTGASGLDASTVSTANDLVKLGVAAMRDPTFAGIVAMRRATLPLNGTVANTNTLLGHDGVIGVKTGFTSSAGGCLLFAATTRVGQQDVTIVGAVLGQRGSDADPLAGALAASRSLIRAGLAGLREATVVRAGSELATVQKPFGGTVPVTVARDVSVVGWPGAVMPLTVSAGPVPTSAPAGTQVGWLTVGAGAQTRRVPLVLGADLAAPSLTQRLTRLG